MTSRHALVTAVGFTHASSVIALVSCSGVEFGTVTRELVPLKETAPLYFPAGVRVTFASVPVLPFPDASVTVVPDVSSKEYAATRPPAAASVADVPIPGDSTSSARATGKRRPRQRETCRSRVAAVRLLRISSGPPRP